MRVRAVRKRVSDWNIVMPPLEWSMVQSILLSLIAPTVGAAFALMIVVVWSTHSETIRSTMAPIAFLAGLTVGLAVQNSHGDLVPFLALQQVEHSTDGTSDIESPQSSLRWEFETGWRSLYFATLFAGLAEILIESLFRQRSRFLFATIASCLVASISTFLLCPWDLTSTQPWAYGTLAILIVLNEMSLRRASQLKFKSFVPIALAILWGGSTIAVMVLSHSARFADLALLLGSSLAGVGFVMALARVQPKAIFAGPACFVPALMLGAQQNTHSDIPIPAYALIASAPVWLGILYLGKVRNWIESRPILVAIWFLIPCAVAVGLAMRAEL